MTNVYLNVGEDNERRYNRSLKATRRVIKCAYGIMKERFPCLNHLRVQPEYAGKIIMCCATLHNIASKKDFEWNQESGNDDDEVDPHVAQPRIETGNSRQNELLAYFS
jgi:hypothetical protein